jgi:hypothetical protein
VLRVAFIPAQHFSRGPLNPNWRSQRRFLDARAERAAGRARAKAARNGLARRASAATATTESGVEAEIAGGVGVRRGAATRSLRSARGAAHSVDAVAGLVW